MTNWALSKKRALMHKRGIAYTRKESSPTVHRTVDEHSPNWRRPRGPSKDELRGEAVRAFMEWRAKRAAKVDA